MRGEDRQSKNLFSYIRLETRILAEHPLRPIRKLVDEALLGPSMRPCSALTRSGKFLTRFATLPVASSISDPHTNGSNGRGPSLR
jgi:hypothetical protein